MVEVQRCPTPAIFYFLKNAVARRKDTGARSRWEQEGKGGDRMRGTIAAGRLTYFHEVMD